MDGKKVKVNVNNPEDALMLMKLLIDKRVQWQSGEEYELFKKAYETLNETLKHEQRPKGNKILQILEK